MFVRAHTAVIAGIDAVPVTVEADISNGIGMSLVGLPDNAVRESQERIRSAFGNCGYRMTGRKLVVNLAPADLRKEGTALDLPIACAILAASGQLEPDRLGRYMILGELSLDGAVNPVRGILPLTIQAKKEGFEGVVVPAENFAEASIIPGIEVVPVAGLADAVNFLSGGVIPAGVELSRSAEDPIEDDYHEDFSDVRGQQTAKRALEIAAAGGHNVLMVGSPGSGKTMLARRLPTILPPLTDDEALETTKIHSVAGRTGSSQGLVTVRPFRSPHHLSSPVSLVGGGSSPMPGEISLAHNGVLFLDELPEFGRGVLEVLRQPLEDGHVTVSRAKYSVEYPANFMLVAAMNPCPCGYWNHPQKDCSCTAGAVGRYMNKISGPLLDRIDLHIEVAPVPVSDLRSERTPESSEKVRERVLKARRIQSERFAAIAHVHTNAKMNSRMLAEFCPLDTPVASILERAMNKLGLSARAYDRIIKVARTIADLAGSPEIKAEHIAEAVGYRSLDRTGLI